MIEVANLTRCNGFMGVWTRLCAALVFGVTVISYAESQSSLEAQLDSSGTENQETSRENFDTDELFSHGGPYCGAYCMYAASAYFGLRAAPEEFINPDYLSSPHGSSISDLGKMAEDNGLYSLPATNLTWRALRESPYPIILHLRDEQGGEGGHFVLCMGVRGKEALIFDPPHLTHYLPLAKLAIDWDGVGIFLSPEPISRADVRYMGVLADPVIPIFFITVCIGILLSSYLKKRFGARLNELSLIRPSFRTFLDIAGILLVSTLLSTLLNWTSSFGLINNHAAAEKVSINNLENLLPIVNADDVAAMLDEEDVVVVDARQKRDYLAAHLKSALNLPPTSTMAEVTDMMESANKKSKILIYCQSSSCPYAVMVTKKLNTLGFNNVYYFKGGWSAWRSGSVP